MSDGTSAKERPADLGGQLESLFSAVWACERQWRLDDRFDLLLGVRRSGGAK